MFESRCRGSAFSGDYGSGRSIQCVGEEHSAFGVAIFETGRLVDAFEFLAPLFAFPFGNVRLLDEILFRNFGIRDEDIGEKSPFAIVFRGCLNRRDGSADDDAGILKRGNPRSLLVEFFG